MIHGAISRSMKTGNPQRKFCASSGIECARYQLSFECRPGPNGPHSCARTGNPAQGWNAWMIQPGCRRAALIYLYMPVNAPETNCSVENWCAPGATRRLIPWSRIPASTGVETSNCAAPSISSASIACARSCAECA